MTFECATNETATNVTGSSSLFFVTFPLDMGSVSSSIGMISLDLTATSEVNGTIVTCHADNGTNTTAVTEPAYVYVQGQYNISIILCTIISNLIEQ